MEGKRTFLSEYPDIAREWHSTKNGNLTPDKVSYKSGKKVWWLGPCGHEWQAKVCDRANGQKCPICSNHQLLVGFNDLATAFPEIASEWHKEKNGSLTPQDVFPKAGKKVWWRCSKCGWEWEAAIYSRTGKNGNGTRCPHCSSNKTSFPEQAVYYYVKKHFPDAISRDYSNGFELDIFIPSINVGVEYDGRIYHNDSKDSKKDHICRQKGIRLFRIREHGLSSTLCSHSIIRNDDSDHSLEKAIIELLELLNVKNDEKISIESDNAEIYSQYYEAELSGNVSELYPELVAEWHPIKNGNLTPNRCKAHSGRKVWWICKKCGREYRAIVAQKVKGHSCPYCSGRKTITGQNDLATRNPALAAQWHPFLNGALLPKDVKEKSNKKAWWFCPVCKHEWEASIYSRSNGNGCPRCAGQRLVPEENDLITKNPLLAREWHPTKNGELSPKLVMASSGKKVWWKCSKCGNEWEATIASRNEGRGCPVCGIGKSAQAKWKPVVQLSLDNDVIKVYKSIKAAREETGATSIIACCKGTRKQSGGYKWKYLDEMKSIEAEFGKDI